jgi:hypothetical protein
MYGLPQAGILAQELLEQRLNKQGYRQSPITPGLWRHNYRPISFTLCVDDFGIKYVGREHAEHLASILGKHYKCSHDWNEQRYLSMTIDWDYERQMVHASMLDYIPKALTRFQHPTPRIPQHQPYPHVKPTYGAKAQYTEEVDSSAPLNKQGKKYVQEVIGTFFLLRTLCRQHHATSTRIPRHTTGKSNAKHQKNSPSTSRLRGHTSRCHHHI